MMSYISENFYEKSYVMKWCQQVMGLEWDEVEKVIQEELPRQFFPETATWGLMYHEQKWQLPVRTNYILSGLSFIINKFFCIRLQFL